MQQEQPQLWPSKLATSYCRGKEALLSSPSTSASLCSQTLPWNSLSSLLTSLSDSMGEAEYAVELALLCISNSISSPWAAFVLDATLGVRTLFSMLSATIAGNRSIFSQKS